MYEASLLISFLVFCVGLVIVVVAALAYGAMVWAGISLLRDGIRNRSLKQFGEGVLMTSIMGGAALLVAVCAVVPELFY